jgi:hypothetical protein
MRELLTISRKSNIPTEANKTKRMKQYRKIEPVLSRNPITKPNSRIFIPSGLAHEIQIPQNKSNDMNISKMVTPIPTQHAILGDKKAAIGKRNPQIPKS